MGFHVKDIIPLASFKHLYYHTSFSFISYIQRVLLNCDILLLLFSMKLLDGLSKSILERQTPVKRRF